MVILDWQEQLLNVHFEIIIGTIKNKVNKSFQGSMCNIPIENDVN